MGSKSAFIPFSGGTVSAVRDFAVIGPVRSESRIRAVSDLIEAIRARAATANLALTGTVRNEFKTSKPIATCVSRQSATADWSTNAPWAEGLRVSKSGQTVSV